MDQDFTDGSKEKELPRYNNAGQQINHNGHAVHRWVQPDGESGRRWFSPWHFLRICFRSTSRASMYTNFLWPFTIAAMILHFGFGHEHQLWVFITCYIGMVPAANLVGFGGQELARKIPKVAGIILETTFGSIVEIILFNSTDCGWREERGCHSCGDSGEHFGELAFLLGYVWPLLRSE